MDLTKIVLPTFILERRSLLEMYGDFFVHPEIFTDISSKSSPEDRMVQVKSNSSCESIWNCILSCLGS